MTAYSFLSGTSEINSVQVDRVLRVSTCHMLNLNEDLSPWHWGASTTHGYTWLYAYQEDCKIGGKNMPKWLLNLCLVARSTYGCNWILLEPDAQVIHGLPTYEHP